MELGLVKKLSGSYFLLILDNVSTLSPKYEASAGVEILSSIYPEYEADLE
jgi:hypothetical protein